MEYRRQRTGEGVIVEQEISDVIKQLEEENRYLKQVLGEQYRISVMIQERLIQQRDSARAKLEKKKLERPDLLRRMKF